MNRERLEKLTPYQIIAGAAIFSIFCSLTIYLVSRAARKFPSRGGPGNGRPEDTRGQPHPNPVPDQPAIDLSVPAEPPDHFSEEVIIPGFTETGAEIARDDEQGRSPGGV